jgi:hypothetical protein
VTIISLHLPKTAGTSFGDALSARFAQRYRRDYDDGGISRPADERQAAALAAGAILARQGLGDAACVHGHFLPVKYLPLAASCELIFVTWMREPVARLLSHYYYWQESYDEKSSAPHHRQVIEEGWTLEKFCLSERFRNIYAQYLWCFPLHNFAFVGISEHYAEDLLEFSRRYLSTPLEPAHRNATKNGRTRRQLDEGFLQEVRAFHAQDMQLYRDALELRRRRLAGETGATVPDNARGISSPDASPPLQ